MYSNSPAPRPFRKAATCLMSLMLSASPLAAAAQVNNPPTAVDDTGQAAMVYREPYNAWFGGSCVNVLTNDSDPNQNPLSVIASERVPLGESGMPGDLQVQHYSDGNICFDFVDEGATYELYVYIAYTVSDGQGGEDSGLLTITLVNG